MSIPIYPLHISFKDWVSHMKTEFPNIFLPNPLEIQQWHLWAEVVVLSNNLPNVPEPTRLLFPKHTDWDKWAAYFLDSII